MNNMLQEIKEATAKAKAQAAAMREQAAAPVAAAPAIVQRADAPALAESADWGAIEELETTDLLVPKIFHQQATSAFAKDGVARPGDFCDSLTGAILAKKEEPLEVIIFGAFKTMVISRWDPRSQKFELDAMVTLTPQNAREYSSKPLQEEINGETFKNSLQYNFYCLLPKMINELPYVLSLGGTKTKAARKLNTMLYKLQQIKRPGASVVFELTSVLEKNDRGSWFGLEVKQGRNTEPQELMRAHAWYLKSKSQKFTVVEGEQSLASDNDINL